MLLSMLAPPGAVPVEELLKFYEKGKKMNYAMVKDGVVVNVIDWDGITPYTPPEGCELYEWEGPVDIGWAWVDGHPVDPNPPPKPQPIPPIVPPEGGGPAVL